MENQAVSNMQKQELSDEKIKKRCKYSFIAGIVGVALIILNPVISFSCAFSIATGYANVGKSNSAMGIIVGCIFALFSAAVVYLPYIIALSFSVSGRRECICRNMTREQATFKKAIILNIIALAPIALYVILSIMTLCYGVVFRLY